MPLQTGVNIDRQGGAYSFLVSFILDFLQQNPWDPCLNFHFSGSASICCCKPLQSPPFLLIFYSTRGVATQMHWQQTQSVSTWRRRCPSCSRPFLFCSLTATSAADFFVCSVAVKVPHFQNKIYFLFNYACVCVRVCAYKFKCLRS